MLRRFLHLLAFAATLFSGSSLESGGAADQQGRSSMPTTAAGDQTAVMERAIRRRALANARQAAAERARPAREAAKAQRAASRAVPATVKGREALAPPRLAPGLVAPPGVMNPLGTPDYMGGVVPNYANSPIIRKFVDTLPGLGPQNANNLGNFLPVAIPDTTTFPGSDFYNIGVVDYTQQLHSDLPATHLRGYKDLNPAADGKAHYFGPFIFAFKDRPVRAKLNNLLPTGAAGNLLLPVDTSLMGSGAGPGGSTFTQNRALFHLHGGLSPWISDGTPHQWVTPAGDPTPNKKGVSFRNVPDMVGSPVLPSENPGDGIATYFYTNQQSGRMMWYHDHSFGLTRLNIYSGEAAGYLIVDPTEIKLINDGILPNQGGGVNTYGIPLVVQDKTFVPNLTDLANQDPTWDLAHWGGTGDLWFPHVYMPNQNPSDPSGANGMGRWDYGPWFWPPIPYATDPNAPTPQFTIPYDHRPIPGANPGDPEIPGTPNPSAVPEAFMDTPLINGTPYPKMTVEPKAYRFRILNAANDRMFAFSFYTADPANPTEVVMIPATPAEAAQGPKDANGVPLWPTDGRDGGVVDFRTAGPDIIQIGNDSGFLPTPVVHKSQATTYNYNRRDIVVLDIANHGLFLGPAERADVVVDFSAWAGKTLILYNDMLAPVPAFDVRYDYFTGDPDQTATGGAPTTLPGYGPNTRTLMQIEVANTAPAAPFDLAALNAAFTSTPTSKGAFAASQRPPIVPQSFFNSAMNTNYPNDPYATIQSYDLSYTRTENGQPTTSQFMAKAIAEEFELNYGRMNATLGFELPFTNFNNQTTIPLGYSEPASEILTDGTTQFWKVTHNGVDTHPVHFHLFDVQIINRVGWDGAVRFPEPNELGWKDTVKMKPLEDIVVAFRPISPRLPFYLGNSKRVIDPTKDANSIITVTDLAAGSPNQGNLGNPIDVVNDPNTDYGWEYVWHCHILGHEENDFMRPIVLNVATAVPDAPTGLTATLAGPGRADLAWTDVATNETGYSIQRRTGSDPFATIATVVPDTNTYSDLTIAPGSSYAYQVIAYNQAGDSAASNLANLGAASAIQVAGQVFTFDGTSNLPLAGVTLTFSNGGGTATTDAKGAYSASVPLNWAGTVTPSLAGFLFTPASRTYAALTANQADQNFVGRNAAVSITGSVKVGATALAGVVLNASTGETATTDASGNYTFTLPNPYTGTITPVLANYSFTPASRTYTAIGVDQAAQNYAASAIVTIAGQVTLNTVGLPGVTMSFSTGQTVTTLADGTYSLTLPAPYTGTVTPSKPGYFIAPISQGYSAITANQVGQNYTAVAAVMIYGIVTTNAVPAVPLPGVTLTFSNGAGTATTDANGSYTHYVPSGWSGSITPSLAGWSFNPLVRNLTNVLSSPAVGQNFSAGVVYAISGAVTTNGAPLAGVRVTFSNAGGFVLTAADGTYTFSLRSGWTGTITPTLAGYLFTPTSVTVSAPLAGPLTQNFATRQTISGRAQIRVNGVNVGLQGVIITLSTGGTVTTDVNGNFTIQVPTGWSGSLSASDGGVHVWSPATFTYGNLTSNITGLRFNGV
jgi:FtsP/CotA-like multicopper oxidase with cupredoxin domain